MSVFTPSSQVLERHESLFADKNLLVAGDFHDDYVLQLQAAQTKIHCTQFHTYLTLLSRCQHAQIEFGVLPPASFYENVDTLIYYWPKNKAEAQFQLSFLLNSLPKGVDVFIIGENRSGVKSAEVVLNDFGSIQKIDGARRCSLYHFYAESRLAFYFDEWWYQYHLQMENISLTICSLPGVFSQKALDAGSNLLLNALADYVKEVRGRVLDIGCGCGILSAFAGKLNPTIELVVTDVNAMALLATEQTLQLNNVNAEIIASDVFSHISGKFDLIISNPPFHDGKETSYSAVDMLIQQGKQFLTASGKLCIVANSFLPYHHVLTAQFDNVQIIAKTTKFKVYLAS